MDNPVDNTHSEHSTSPTSNRVPTVSLTVSFSGHRSTVSPCPYPYGTRDTVERPADRVLFEGHGRSGSGSWTPDVGPRIKTGWDAVVRRLNEVGETTGADLIATITNNTDLAPKTAETILRQASSARYLTRSRGGRKPQSARFRLGPSMTGAQR